MSRKIFQFNVRGIQLSLLSLVTLFLIVSSFTDLHAQVTSSSISGVVKDKKEVLVGATIIATHKPTGTKYGIQTDFDGRYAIENMLPGGPYNISLTFVGYQTQEKNDLQLPLGERTVMNLIMQESTNLLEVVNVVGEKKKDNDDNSNGKNISQEQMRSLPTLSRSLNDMTKLSPQNNNNSFGGTNFRYNNVTIDGAVNNDAIGFSPSLGGQTNNSGMPGSSTRTNPISLDAIQDIQVYVAPYDVKIGNFTGGSINAVTRSGTNDVIGSVYGFGRNATLTGKNNAGDKSKLSSEYHDYQTGFRIGFPIIKNKLFFFTNAEITRRQEPLNYKAGSTDVSGNLVGLLDVATAQRISDTLKNRYNFDAGAFGNYNIYSKSAKWFNRLDWNISDKTSLAIRNNYIESEATNLERDAANFRFSSMDFVQHNTTNSTVGELKSRITNHLNNSLIVGFTQIHDYRDPLSNNVNFPQVEVGYKGGTIFFGNDREATVFNLRQKTLELTDNLTFSKGKHHFLVGTHNELYTIDYGFVNSWNGRVAYSSLDNFYKNQASRVRGSYSLLGDNTRASLFEKPYAQFKVNMLSVYGQDEMQLTDNLIVTTGLRLDKVVLPTKPPLSTQAKNAVTDSNYGSTYTYTTLPKIDNNFLSNINISPRLGFKYDVKGDKSLILRGGSGVFTGKIPFAWLGYAYYNDGIGFGSFDVRPDYTKTVAGDPLTSARDFAFKNGQSNQTQVDVIANNFRTPQVWRSSLAVDYTINGYKFTLEGLYTKTLQDLLFQQVNLKDSVRYYSYDTQKQQPIYVGGNLNKSLSNAYELSNTQLGKRYSITAQVQKAYNFGLSAYMAYTLGKSFDLTNGIRNSMESNWQMNQSLTPNNPALALSNFDLRHRIISTFTYKKAWNETHTTYATLLTNIASGNPYTWGFINANIAGTPQATGLAYIPRDQAEMVKYLIDAKDAAGNTQTAAQQAQAFDQFVSSDAYLNSRRGNFTERNTGRTPWNATADLRIMHDIHLTVKGKTNTLQISWDVINFSNLINPNWGRIYFVPNTFNSTAGVGLTRATDPVTKKTVNAQGDPIYTFAVPTTPYSIDQLASRWQMQLGVRYTF
jgi:Carboxypeptidase regulatory-like domain